MRRSDSAPISATASAEIVGREGHRLGVEVAARQHLGGIRPVFGMKTSGLSVTPFASRSSTTRAASIWSRQAPMTCGWQRRLYGSCTLPHSRWLELIGLSASNSRYAAAAAICPGWPRSSWMRASKGLADPSAASTDSAPATSAVAYRLSMANRFHSASAVEVCVPLSSARPSLAANVIGSRPARFRPSARRQDLAVALDLADA